MHHYDAYISLPTRIGGGMIGFPRADAPCATQRGMGGACLYCTLPTATAS